MALRLVDEGQERSASLHPDPGPTTIAAITLLGRYHGLLKRGSFSPINYRRYKLLFGLFTGSARGSEMVKALLNEEGFPTEASWMARLNDFNADEDAIIAAGDKLVKRQAFSALVRLWASIPTNVCPNHHIAQGGWETALTPYGWEGRAMTVLAVSHPLCARLCWLPESFPAFGRGRPWLSLRLKQRSHN